MSISSAVTKIDALTKNDLLDRVVKTVVEVVAVQSALYTTVVPNPPSIQTSGALAGGAGLLALVINGIITWAKKNQAAKLAELETAIQAAARVYAQAEAMSRAAAVVPAAIPEVPAV